MEQNYRGFATWEDVLAFARRDGDLYYQAPLDLRPVRVEVLKVSGHGHGEKLRLKPPTRDADPFWADAGHLDRFCSRNRNR